MSQVFLEHERREGLCTTHFQLNGDIMSLVRYRDTNGPNLFIQTRKIDLITILPWLFVKSWRILRSLFKITSNSDEDENKLGKTDPAWIYGDYTNLYNEVIFVDIELNQLADRITDLINKRSATIDYINDRKKWTANCTKATRGYSYVFKMDLSKLEKVGLNVEPVEQRWKFVLKQVKGKGKRGYLQSSRDRSENNEFVNTENVGLIEQDESNFNSVKMPGTTNIIIQDSIKQHRRHFDEMAEDIGAGDTVVWKNPDEKNNNNKNNQGGDYSKKKRKDKQETDLSHKKRIEAIDNGTFDPNNWDYTQ